MNVQTTLLTIEKPVNLFVYGMMLQPTESPNQAVDVTFKLIWDKYSGMQLLGHMVVKCLVFIFLKILFIYF